MSVYEASDCGRIVRAQRCRCGEFPQLSLHTGRGFVWFSCACGKVSQESADIDRAIVEWNTVNTWGEKC